MPHRPPRPLVAPSNYKIETLPRNYAFEMMTQAQAARTTSTSAPRKMDEGRPKLANAQCSQLVARALRLKSTLEAEGKLAKPKTASTPSVGGGPSSERDGSTNNRTMVQRAAPLAPTASTSQANKRPGQAAIAASMLGAPPATASVPASSLAPTPKPRFMPARKPSPTPVSKPLETSTPKLDAAPAGPAALLAPVPRPSTAARRPRTAIRPSTFELVVPVICLPRKKRKDEHPPRAMVPRAPSISPVAMPDPDAIATSLTLGAEVEQSGSTSSASMSRTPSSSTSMAQISTLADLRKDSMVINTKPGIRELEMALTPQPVLPMPPVAPAAPIAPIASIAPTARVSPVAPSVPLAHVAPALSVAPVASLAPVAPVASVAPVVPFAAVAPVIDGRPILQPLGGRPGIMLRNVEPPAPPEMRLNPLLEYFIRPAPLLGCAVRPYDPNDKGKRKARAPSSVPPERLPTPSIFASVDFMSAESFGLRRTQRVAQQALRPCDVPAPLSVTPHAASASSTSSSDDDDEADSDVHSDTEHHFDFVLNTRRGHPELDRQLLSFEIDYGSDNEEDFAQFCPKPQMGEEVKDGEGYTTRWRLDGIDEGRRGITRALEIDAGMNGRFFAAARPTPPAEMIKAWEAHKPNPPAKGEVSKSKKHSKVVFETDSEFEVEDGEVVEDSDSDYAKSHAKSSRVAATKAKVRPQLFIPPPLHRKPTHFASIPNPFALAATFQPAAFMTTSARPAAPPRLQQSNEVTAKVQPIVPPLGPANRTLPQAFVNHAAHPAIPPRRPQESVASIPPRSRSTSPVTHLAPQPWAAYQQNVQTQTQTERLVGSAPLHPALRATVPPPPPTAFAPQPSAYSVPVSQRSLSPSPALASTPRSSAQASAYKPARDLVRVPMVMQRNASPFLHVSALSQRPAPSSSMSATVSRSAMVAVDPRLKARGIPGIRPTSFPRPPIVGAHASGSQGPAQAEPTFEGGRLGGPLHEGAVSR